MPPNANKTANTKIDDAKSIIANLEQEIKGLELALKAEQTELTRVFEFQLQFILKAGLKKVIDGNYHEISFEELIEIWPNKLIGRVFRLLAPLM